jgi:hypothetical protein
MCCASKIKDDLLRKVFGAEVRAIGRASEASIVRLYFTICRAPISSNVIAVIARQGKSFTVSTDLITVIGCPVVGILRSALKTNALGKAAQTSIRARNANLVGIVK